MICQILASDTVLAAASGILANGDRLAHATLIAVLIVAGCAAIDAIAKFIRNRFLCRRRHAVGDAALHYPPALPPCTTPAPPTSRNPDTHGAVKSP